MTTPTTNPRLDDLARSRERVLALADAGRLDPAALRALADAEALRAFDLVPWPTDPAAHLRAEYALTRPYLERLPRHDPARAVGIGGEAAYEYTFTPRTVLRRVLDHHLDHLNQVEQWLRWQELGEVPTPTDGWASSADNLEEDTLPIGAADLSAWLWRIDLAVEMLAQRVERLTPAQLDWTPPADPEQWPLRRAIHHVARSRFYAVWLDEELPADPPARDRYAEANRRCADRLARALAEPCPPGHAYFASGAGMFTPAQALAELLAAERALLATA